jgi:hypothetical protein
MRRRLLFPSAGLFVLALILPGNVVAVDAQSASQAESGSGRSSPGARFSPAAATRTSADVDASAQVGVPAGRQFDDATVAAMRAAAQRRQVDVPTATADTAVDAAPAAAIPNAPILSGSYDAFPYTGWIPPDPTLAVGPSDQVVAVNESFRIYDKSLPGTQLFNTTFISWFANVLPSPNSGFSVYDPWPIYDQVSGRFIILATAKRTSDSKSLFLISVSDNNSAAGSWCNWSLNARLNGSTNTSNWADYSKAGTTGNAVVLSTNMYSPFTGSATFQYAKLRFLEKSQLFDTTCPGLNWWDFWNLKNPDSTLAFTIQPSLSYLSSDISYLVNHETSGSGSGLTNWKTDTTTCCTSAPTLSKTAITTVNYTIPPGAQQKGTATTIDTGDTRLLGAVYRSSGVWTSTTTGCTISGDPTVRACIRWYDINPTSSTLMQQETFGASGAYYWFPRISADGSGDAAVTFSRSSSSAFASIRFTGRLSTDAPSTLQGSTQLKAGQGCYVRLDSSGTNRWGDYNGAAVDPSTNKTWWLFSEYPFGTSATCTNNTWQTTVGKVHF